MVLGYRMGILLAATPLPQVCQEASSGHGQFTVRISVDSGSLPFSAILNSGEHHYVARREALRASTVRFSDVPGGMHLLTVDMPGGKRSEHLVEANAHYAGQRGRFGFP